MIPGIVAASGPYTPPTPPAGVTWNPSDKASEIILSSGDLVATRGSGSTNALVRATLARSSGKYCFAVRCDTLGSSDFTMYGIANSSAGINGYCGQDGNGYGFETTGFRYHSGAGSSYGSAWGAGDVITWAVDFGAGKVWVRVNSTWQGGGDPVAGTGDMYSGISGPHFPAASLYSASPQHQLTASFTDLFGFSVPSGFSLWES